MSGSNHAPDGDAGACQCCAGAGRQAPVLIDNRPGLKAIVASAGTHAQFKASMLAALSRSRKDGRPTALAELQTRGDDDFSIALLDCAATIADVLGFYTDRIANESYLRTATQSRSVLELARMIGYELKPGVAASTSLAFTVEDATGAPGFAQVAAGTRVESLPGPGEKPQVFETTESLLARKEWNELRARSRAPSVPRQGDCKVYLKGTSTSLRLGDVLLFHGVDQKKLEYTESFELRRVREVQAHPHVDPELAYAEVTLDQPLTETSSHGMEVHVLRLRAGLFGHNAPDPQVLPPEITKTLCDVDPVAKKVTWRNMSILSISGESKEENKIHLDAVYPTIVAGSHVLLTCSKAAPSKALFTVKEVSEESLAAFGLAAKVTCLTFEQSSGLKAFTDHIRDTTVFAQSERLEWALRPTGEELSGSAISLDRGLEPHLPGGRRVLVVSPGQTGSEDEPKVEQAIVRRVDNLTTPPTLVLATPLIHSHPTEDVVIYGNVTAATHGETVREVLGSGDATQARQRFTLRQTPLTYTAAPTASGGESTLQIWVDGIRWRESPTLFNLGPADRSYTVRHDDDGKCVVTFGDGRNGARLPTGTENVRAVYRKGMGREGVLKSDQIKLLMTRPLGVKSVSNPVASGGAADPEKLEGARRRAPTRVLTFDRVVSLSDYEDFARAYSGITKAQAVWTWNSRARGVFLTVAPEDPCDKLSEDREPIRGLLVAFRKLGSPLVPVVVKPYFAAKFRIAGRVRPRTLHDAGVVQAAVRSALESAYAFDARSLGQSVALSELMATIQSVAGVEWVDLDALYRGDKTPALLPRLDAHRPSPGCDVENVQPAELLTLDAASLPALEVTQP